MKNYVKEYKGYKVPDGATHTIGLGNFYKVVRGEVYYFDNVGEFVLSNAGHRYLKENLEPLPKAPQVWNGEGLPPIGTVCECFVWTNFAGGEKRWVPRPVIGYSKTSMSETHMGKAGIVIDSCERDGQFIFCDEFRPLKTQREKDREAFVKGLVKVLNSVPNGTSLSDLHAMAEKAYDAGYTAPKAADNDKK